MLHRLLDRTDHLHSQHQSEVFGVVIIFGRRNRLGIELAELFVAAQLHAVFLHRRDEGRHEPLRDFPVDQQGFQRIAGAGALDLRIHDDFDRFFHIAFAVDVKVTDPFVVFQHRHRRLGTDQPDQPFAAARDDQIEILIHLEQQIHRRVIRPRHQLHRAVGQAAPDRRPVHDPGQNQIGVKRLAAAAQDHRVARLETDSRRIDGHIRARFVNNADHAQRNADLGDFEAVGTDSRRQHAPDRIVLGGDHAQPVGHLLNPAVGQGQPVDHRRCKTGLFRLFKVLGIGGFDRLRGLFDPAGHHLQAAVFLVGREDSQRARGGFRLFTHFSQRRFHQFGCRCRTHGTIPLFKN